jgi:catechol 2,3-dioxygenase-like lactoylglutathione lyase family enzyme
MLRKPLPVLFALAVLLMPVCPAQQQASTAPNAASAKTGAAMPSERGRILGIGGIFFKSANQQQMREWYGKHLGLADKGGGVMMPWREKDNPEKEHVTVWTVFPGNTKYFEPSQAAFMVNYIVDDLDALLERLQKEGVKIDPKRQNEDYGRFAWIYDPDGNKIELWQPLTPKEEIAESKASAHEAELEFEAAVAGAFGEAFA